MAESTLTDLVEAIARRAAARGKTVAVAESLTSGSLVSELGKGTDAAAWLRGAVVAYSAEVKREVLGVSDGPVVTARCAEEMASGVASLLASDVAIAATGAGGPDPVEGRAAGTVYLGWWCDDDAGHREFLFEGDPAEVVGQTVQAGLELLGEILREHP